MRDKIFALAVLAPLAGFVPVSHAVTLTSVQTFGGSVSSTDVARTYTFSGLTFNGFDFSLLVGPGGVFSSISGTLTSVSVNATLDASELYTYADDLTIYVDPAPLSSGGMLQVGGFSDLEAAERHSWGNGDSSAPGTTVIGTVALTTPITFAGTASDPRVYIGNGYGDPDAVGTWSGSVTLTISAVPEPSTWALFAAGSVGMAAWLRRRRSIADQG